MAMTVKEMKPALATGRVYPFVILDRRVAKNDQEEALDKILAANLTRAIDFVKFAEAKNAALLTFNSAWVIGLSNIYLTKQNLPAFFDRSIPIAIGLFVVSALLSILSFLPKTAVSYFHGSNHRSANLLFVGDIENELVPDLKERMKAKYLPAEDRSLSDGYVDDLIQQISINSKIAMRKFRRFHRSAAITLIAMVVLFIPYAINFSYLIVANVHVG